MNTFSLLHFPSNQPQLVRILPSVSMLLALMVLSPYQVEADVSWNTVGHVQACHVCDDGSEWLIVQDIVNGTFSSSSHQTSQANNFQIVTVDNASEVAILFDLSSGSFPVEPGKQMEFEFAPGLFSMDFLTGQFLPGHQIEIAISTDSPLVFQHIYDFPAGESQARYRLMEFNSDTGKSTNVLETRVGIPELFWTPEVDAIAGEFILGLPPVTLGDVNGDGAVNLLDVAPFVDLLANGGFDFAADINQDHHVDLLDVQPFITILSGG